MLLKGRLYIFLGIILLIAGCYSYNNSVLRKDVAFLYKPSSSKLHPNYSVYHTKDTITRLYFSVPLKELLFTKQIDADVPSSKFELTYKLYDYDQNNHISDSGSTVFHIIKPKKGTHAMNYIEVNASKGKKYIVELKARDVVKNSRNTNYIFIDKTSNYNNQNFLISNTNDIPYFRNYFDSSEIIKIKYRDENITKLFISYFDERFPLAPPPFSIKPVKPNNILPDSSWQSRYNGYIEIRLPKPGIYHIQKDTNSNKGLTLLYFREHYPEFLTPIELLEPLQFLTQKKEYRDYKMYSEKKLAVDNFWLGCSGNTNRARELIKVYYSRAKYANLYFSSHKEGWKTDRGMIYMIFGPPNTIYKSKNSEQWIYGDNVSISSMTFVFNQMDNPFSDNNYILTRNEGYATIWHQAVEAWRDGRVFSISQ